MSESKNIAKKLLEIKAVIITNQDNLFTWASGIKSPIYCDNRLIMGYPEFRNIIANEMAKIVLDLDEEIDVIVGTATAGIPHAAWVSNILNKPMAYVRSSSKEHGKQNKIEGLVKKGDNVVIIEDLFSTGGSAINAVHALHDVGANIIKVISIFSYNFDVLREKFEKENIDYISLTDYKTLLPIAVETGYVKEAEYEILKKWNKNPKMFE